MIDFVNASMGSYHDAPSMLPTLETPVGAMLPSSGPIAAAALISVLLVSREPAASEVRLGSFMLAGIRCVGCTALLAAIPWCALFWAVRRGMPLPTDKAGALIGAAAFSFAFAATRLGCPIDDSVHLLAWHVLPVAAGTALSIAAGKSLRPHRI